jgi:acyl-CoA synthetase (AMP-forming)/AMP-acid ligase II
MSTPGFRHLAAASPNHLALAAPDGHHWRRDELLAECRRLIQDVEISGLTHDRNSAGPVTAIALRLSMETTGPARWDCDTVEALHSAKTLMDSCGIEPEGDNLFYCIDPMRCEASMAWAVAAIHYGHPVVLADQWQPASMLRDIERYRITYSYITPGQLDDLLALTREVTGPRDLSSMHCLLQGGAPCSEQVCAALMERWGLELRSQPHPATTARLAS